MTADYYMDLHWEAFQLWLASIEAVAANDNTGESTEGWPL